MFCFLLFGRPAQTAKNKHAPALSPITPQQNLIFSKKPPVQTALLGLEARSFLLFGRAGLFVFLLFRRVVVFIFFSCLGGWSSLCFCCLGGGRLFFCCLGGGRLCFLLLWAGDGSSLTYRSAWFVFKGPNNKKDTGSHRFPFPAPSKLAAPLPRLFLFN